MDARKYRTMLYLMESDHYLALSARRPSHLNPESMNGAIASFLHCRFVQSTDMRLASLFQVAYGAHFTNCRPTTIESVEAFDRDVQIVEKQFTSNQSNQSTDTMSQHFPFTSLRWYRLSYTCAFLDNIDQGQRKGKALMWAIDWASQILIHLSMPPSSETIDSFIGLARLEPDSDIVNLMSFAIDHYYVVISYASFFLVNSWLRNFVDLNLQSNSQHSENPLVHERSSSLLYRLVDLAARTLEASSPPEGHLARRYVPLLRGMADLILTDSTQAQGINSDSSAMTADVDMSEQLQNTMGEDLWELWQQAGLEPINWQLPDFAP
ncbi:hypothetical protein LEL_01228 [Akanthomyces lecanii RCEF 1005]|uniref:Fungal transcriptional regulatory protein n=1 Tax=Akanthomyces lecanii RCEF 1005 TaxID=1081108 RepID=A0A168KH40_CORDF|nr:hypothetical protein LEL_01228 [Akanthomyces lecanii RCEF 1005]